MRKISYKCKNCGASVKHSHNKSVLTCAYCNTSYDNFIKIEDVSVDNLVDKLEIFSYCCLGCGNHFNSYEKINKPVCDKCNGIKLEESFQIVNGAILNELVGKLVINDFKGELEGIENFIPQEFFKSDFSLKYVKSKMYDGVINITAESSTGKSINRKYVLFDLIIPDSDTLNYTDIIHIMSNKFYSGKIHYEKKTLSSIPANQFEVNDRKDSNISEIVKICLDDFKKRYHFCSSISVESNIDVQYNFYIPIFQKCTIYKGKKYYNSIVGFRDKNNNGSNFCLNFPPLSVKNKMILKKRFLLKNIWFVFWTIVTLILVIALFVTCSNSSFGPIAYVIFLILIILSVAKSATIHKEISFLHRQIYIYLNEKKLTKNEFYQSLIKEKNKFIFHTDWRE